MDIHTSNKVAYYRPQGKVMFLAARLLKQNVAYLVLSCVWMYVDQNQGTPLPEMAYPLGIPWFQVQIWIHHKNLF